MHLSTEQRQWRECSKLGEWRNGLEQNSTGSYHNYEYQMFQLIQMCQVTRIASCRHRDLLSRILYHP